MSHRRRAKKQHLVQELEDFCASESLCLKGLREKTKNVPPDAVDGSDFMNYACENENVTKGIIEHLIRVYPKAVGKKRSGDGLYPIHSACGNCHCPGSGIKLLLKKDPDLIKAPSDDQMLPLHCYISRWSNYDHRIIEYLVKEYPEALTLTIGAPTCTPLQLLCQEGEEISLELVRLLVDENKKCLDMEGGHQYGRPIISLLSNASIGPPPVNIIQYFTENMASSSLTAENIFTLNILHAACGNENITLQAMRLLLSIGGDMVRTISGFGQLPIHILCRNTGVDDDTTFDILKLLVDEYPESLEVKEGHDKFLPIHHACIHKSFECCKLLIDGYPECVGVNACFSSMNFSSPFHLACANGSLDLVRYLHDLHPNSIFGQNCEEDYEYDDNGNYMDEVLDYSGLQHGFYALHLAASSDHDDRKEIVNFILEKDSKAASRVGKWGRLPLHQACCSSLNLGVIKTIFEAYPKAIHTEDMFGRLPIHFVMGCQEYRKDPEFRDCRSPYALSSKRQTALVIDYLVEQLPYSLMARDKEGRNCAHFAAGSSLSMKKIMAIEERCHESIFKVYSRHHGLPIHIACTEGASIEVVGYLMNKDPLSLLIEYPNIGLPLACAKEPGIFGVLLHAMLVIRRAVRGAQNKPPLGKLDFHSFLVDDCICNNKDVIISKFLEFSQVDSKTHDFQDDIWRKDKKGAYPLHLVFNATKSVGLVSQLIDCYPEAVRKQDRRGWLPLHHALHRNASLEIVRLLVETYPEGVRVEDKQGSTPVHLACRFGSPEGVMEFLVEKLGVDVALSLDNNGCTPLHVACRHGLSFDLVSYLIGLNDTVLTKPDTRGELPLHKACRGGHIQLINQLMALNAPTVSERNATNELPIFILCKRSGKDVAVRDSLEYTEAIWQMLLAHPETVSI